MKRVYLSVSLLLCSLFTGAQNEIGPEGHKLVWGLLIIILLLVLFLFSGTKMRKRKSSSSRFSIGKKRVKLTLEKSSLYYPDDLKLTVKNVGNSDVDLDKPLLVFDNFWLKRKFKIKGQDNYSFYPLFLEKGKTHTLQINLDRFYKHDKRLRKYPKLKLVINEVNGKKLGTTSVFIRKTFFKF